MMDPSKPQIDSPMDGCCQRCGWPKPLNDACPSCGVAPGFQLPTSRATHSATFTLLHPDSFPALKPAFDAWYNKDVQRFVGQCLLLMDINAQVKRAGTISRWSLVYDSAVVYITFDHQTNELSVDSPLVRVPEGHRVGLYRTLLELNEAVTGDSRFSLRSDQVMLTFSDNVDNISPPRLLDAIDEVANLADHYDNILSITFGAPLIGPEAQENRLDWKYLGEAVMVKLPKTAASAIPAIVQKKPVDPKKALLQVLRDTQTQLKAAGFLAQQGVLPYLLHRAAVYRVCAQFGKLVPGTACYLYREAQEFIHDALDEGDPRMPNAFSLSNVYQTIVNHNGQVGKPQELKIKTMGSAHVAPHFGKLRHQLAQREASLATKFFVQVGILAEGILRLPLNENARKNANNIFSNAINSGPTPEVVNQLEVVLGKLK